MRASRLVNPAICRGYHAERRGHPVNSPPLKHSLDHIPCTAYFCPLELTCDVCMGQLAFFLLTFKLRTPRCCSRFSPMQCRRVRHSTHMPHGFSATVTGPVERPGSSKGAELSGFQPMFSLCVLAAYQGELSTCESLGSLAREETPTLSLCRRGYGSVTHDTRTHPAGTDPPWNKSNCQLPMELCLFPEDCDITNTVRVCVAAPTSSLWKYSETAPCKMQSVS